MGIRDAASLVVTIPVHVFYLLPVAMLLSLLNNSSAASGATEVVLWLFTS